MRLPKQVLIVTYRVKNSEIEYCIFKRKDLKCWQWISGGMEDFDKDLIDTAKRELYEETSIKDTVVIESLEIVTKIPVVNVVGDFMWGKDVFYSEEYGFAVDISNQKISLSNEHEEYRWVNYAQAQELLKYDSNKSALWELNEKLKRKIERHL